ncbi:MAG: hypothetical protein QOI21_3079 [Actinomycetota bacterium]|jgi:hypothetical protein|nr:hypothetical protein [Actinomycetota bacterium]
MSKTDVKSPSFELSHPIYLDAPMLVSFLAALDDGVSFTSEISEKQGQSNKSGGEASGSVKIPSLASLMGLNLSVSGKYSRDLASDQNTESKFIRQHTSASLFNRLRSRLHEDGLVDVLDETSSADRIKPGSIIEIPGRFDIDPMRTIVEYFKSLWPYIEGASSKNVITHVKRSQKRTMSPENLAELEAQELAQKTAEEEAGTQRETRRIVELVEKDMAGSPLVDLVLRQKKLSALVTANREFFGTDVAASLLGGQFSLLGKVTAVEAREDQKTPVVRRGAIGSIVGSFVVPMLDELRNTWSTSGIEIDIPDAYISGPFIQVIPLAIFV